MEKLSTNEFRKVMCIYKIVNDETGKTYIGSTVDLKQRINSHVNGLTNNRHKNSQLQRDWNIYGSDKFHFEIIKIIERIEDLPQTEKDYIEEYRISNGVYNVSDPLQEISRIKKPKRYKGENIKGVKYKITQTYIFAYLDKTFSKTVKQMQAAVAHRKYFDRTVVDDWIIQNVTEEDVKNDERLRGLLHRWHNKNGFYILDGNEYKSTIKKLFDIAIEVKGDILVTPETRKVLYEKRVHKRNVPYYSKSTVKKKAKRKPFDPEKAAKKKIRKKNREIRDKIITDFDYFFTTIKAKVKEECSLEFSKVNEYVLKNFSTTQYSEQEISDNIAKVLKDYNLSVLDFKKPSYERQILVDYGIKSFERSIVSTELSREIRDTLSKRY